MSDDYKVTLTEHEMYLVLTALDALANRSGDSKPWRRLHDRLELIYEDRDPLTGMGRV